MKQPSDPAVIGILMLESRFPRIPGDIGNPQTWPFPVRQQIVQGAFPDKVVRGDARLLLPAFVAGAQALVAEGVDGITTSCGFLAPMQAELAASVPVPVASSSLMQVPMINRLLPSHRRCGVLTISASSLSAEHLSSAGAPGDTPIGSTESGREFTRVILDNEPELDVALARQDNIEAALVLQEAAPELGAIVLECTNMSPYAADIAAATRLPVYSIETFIRWFQSGLRPRQFAQV
ncbi:MAG: aspartate/glutamate racemase family protein [Burkholderiaceae bacterium]